MWYKSILISKIKNNMDKALYEYAKKVFLRDNHTKYHRYCDEWVDNLTDGQWEQIRIWKEFEDSGNLKR
jgi:hypothetical protein